MRTETTKPVRCAIYTQASTDAGLEQDFNSLDAQRDAAEAYIRSQAHAAWTLIRTHYVHILEMNGDSYRLNQSKRRARRASSEPPPDNPTKA